MTHYDVTVDLAMSLSIVMITWVMEPKTKCHYVILAKSSAQNGISTGDLGVVIPFKTGRNTAHYAYYGWTLALGGRHKSANNKR